MPGDYFFLNYGVQDGNVMQGLFRVNKTTLQLEVYNGTEWQLAGSSGGTAIPMTTAQRTAITPASGALIWDTDEEALYVGDGVTAGGIEVAGGGGGGEGTVTGIEASVSGGTATIEATGSTTSVKLVGTDGVLVQGNTNGEVEFGVPAVSKHAVFSNSAATLAANTELVAVENCDNMKNDYITFFANFETFDTLTISHYTSLGGTYLVITETDFVVYNELDEQIQITPHGLTLSDFVYVRIQTNNTNEKRTDVTIATKAGDKVITNTRFHSNRGPIKAFGTMAMSNVNLNYVVSDARCPVWVFGDSYIDFKVHVHSWAYHFVENKHTDVLFCGQSGVGSSTEILSFNALTSKAIPRYVVWAMGMNNPDSESAINPTWKNDADYLIEKCAELGITLIFCTIPNTPVRNNTYKNAYIKVSGLRYIDFAHAVNADAAGATWYDGMLYTDDIHPTELGAITLMNQFIQDCPESVLFEPGHLVDGNRMEILNGTTISQAVWFPTTQVDTTNIVLQPGNAYIANAIGSHVVLFPPTSFPEGKYGLESHLEIFVGKTSYVLANPGVILVDALESDSVNNCLVRFHDGKTIISVEDHVAGYVVVSATGSASGSLPYGVSSSTQDYIVFDATTNGVEIDIGGAITNGSKHLVGNGYTQTILTGTVNITSKTTVSLLGLNNVTISSGTLELGDAYIPNGGMLTVGGGGGLEIRKVSGGGIVDFGGAARVGVPSQERLYASGITFTNGSAGAGPGGAINIVGNASAEFYSCTFSGNSASGPGGAINIMWYAAEARFVSCTITGNTSGNGGGCFCDKAVFEGCTISGNTNSDIRFTESRAVVSATDCKIGVAYTSRGKLYLTGSNHFNQIAGASATVLIGEGAIVDITGAAVNNTINPGGGIVVSGTGCTVINSGGTSVSITGGTYATIKKDGTTA